MYYSPPKSSMWGHSLRKMKPAAQRELVESFFSDAVADYVFATGAVFYQPGPAAPFVSPSFESHFAKLLGMSAPQAGFFGLSEAQFELRYQELLERPSLFEAGGRGATVGALFTISAWRVAGAAVETDSGLIVSYGARPHITPRFSFETMEVFDYLRDALDSVGLCRLNPKHIKGRK